VAVGIQPNLAQLNQQAGQIVLNVRNDMQAVMNFNAYITALGGVSGLEGAPYSMASADASVMVSTFANLAVVATAYQGNGLVAATFNYMENSNLFWGGQ
jgi:hypothetical protein